MQYSPQTQKGDNMNSNFAAVIPNACVRGYEEKTSQKGTNYLIVRFEDQAGRPFTVCDHQVDRKALYKRNVEGDLEIEISTGKFTNISITGFTPKDA